MGENFENQKVITQGESLKASLPFLVVSTFLAGLCAGAVLLYTFNFLSERTSGSDSNTQESNSNNSGSLPEDTYNNPYFNETYFNEVVDTIKQKHIGADSDKDKATYEIVKGYIESLGDKYTYFYDPEEAAAYLKNRSGESLEGIGVKLTFEDNYTKIETVLKGYPAEGAGLIAGDFIISVDGKDVEGKKPEEVATLIRGKEGTKVKLQIIRKDKEENYDQKDFEITRKKIEIDNVSWEKLDNDIVKIDITQFTDATVSDFIDSWDKIVDELEAEAPETKGIIVDLRSNPGGFVLGVKHVTEEFLDSNELIMSEESKSKKVTEYRDQRKGEFEDLPIVVLVNEGSASASEILAAAIQDNDRGKIVGTKTVGKGVEQEIIDLDDGSMLLVVFQKWLTPSGRSITEDEPITPDFEVELTTEDIQNRDDKQLTKALEVLKKEM